MAASFTRSAGERVSKAAASFASGSPWLIAVVPSPSLWSRVWWASAACAGASSEAASRVPAFAFSGSLVQTRVQTGEGVSVIAESVAPCVEVLPRLHRGSHPFESDIAH